MDPKAPSARGLPTVDTRLLWRGIEWQHKLDGLSDQQARATPSASSLSLLGIVKQLAWTEYRWFRESFANETIDDPMFRGADREEFAIRDSDTVVSVLAFYDEQCAISRAISQRAETLEQLAGNDRFPSTVWASPL